KTGAEIISAAQNHAGPIAFGNLGAAVSGVVHGFVNGAEDEKLIGFRAKNVARHRAVLQRIECEVVSEAAAFLAVDLVFGTGGRIIESLRTHALGRKVPDRANLINDVVPELLEVSRLRIAAGYSNDRDIARLCRCVVTPAHLCVPPAVATAP